MLPRRHGNCTAVHSVSSAICFQKLPLPCAALFFSLSTHPVRAALPHRHKTPARKRRLSDQTYFPAAVKAVWHPPALSMSRRER